MQVQKHLIFPFLSFLFALYLDESNGTQKRNFQGKLDLTEKVKGSCQLTLSKA